MDYNNHYFSSGPHRYQQGISNPLILVISPSEDRKQAIQTILTNHNYRIGGPFSTVDEGYVFSRNNRPHLIVFDAINSQRELLFFVQLLKKVLTDVPVIVVHQEDKFAIDHSIIDFLVPPFDGHMLNSKIQSLLQSKELSIKEEAELIVEFINRFTDSLILQSPQSSKGGVQTIMKDVLFRFCEQNPSMDVVQSLSINLLDASKFDVEKITIQLKNLFIEVGERINQSEEATWGQSLVYDTLSSLVVSQENLAPVLHHILIELGINVNKIRTSLATAIPELASLKKHVAVVKLTLSDGGPELRGIVSDDPDLIHQFDDEGIASQILTLVGQGSSYHQGIFGPIPIPRSQQLVAIIWSKLMLSDIEDQRMEGRTLVVVVISMRRELLNQVPPRDNLEAIFEPLESLTHSREITTRTLKEIEFRYENQLM